MKKIISSIALVAAVVSCTKKEITPSDVAPSGEKQIITAYVNAATKVAYTENNPAGGAGMSSRWQEGDSFYAIQDGSSVVTFTLTSGAGTANAVFTAETSGATESTTWKAVLGGAAEPVSTEIHCSFMNQNGTIEGLGNFNYVTASGSGLEPVFNFDNGEKLAYVLRVKLPAGIKCIEYNPCAWYKVTADAVTEQLYSSGNSGQEPNYKAFSQTYTTSITLDHASTRGEFVYIAVPTLNCNLNYEDYNSKKQYGNLRTGFILTFLNDDSDNADRSNGIVLGGDKNVEFNIAGKGGLIGNVDCSDLELINRPKPSDAIPVSTGATTTKKTDNSSVFSTSCQSVNSLETYWAPFNVGAAAATESGYYVGYGELNERRQGDFVSYTLRQKGSDGTNRPAVICYSHSAFPGSGSTTFYTIAGTRYDIARVKWGIAWRMPYLIESWTLWRDHLSNLSTQTISGTKCITVDNGNGQSLCLPCMGWYGDDTTIKDSGMAGLWTADKNQRSASNAGWDSAYGLQIESTTQDYAAVDRYGMHRSLNVRPVLSASKIQ